MSKAISTYTNEQGLLVTVYGYHKPRAGERTWKAIKGSLANTGAKASTLAKQGMKVRSHG